MWRRTVRIVIAWAVLCAGSDAAMAQLFWQRTLGQPLTKRSSPSAQAKTTASGTSGTPGSNETVILNPAARYLRANRKTGDFVGRDRGDQGGFVGLLQAAGDAAKAKLAADDMTIEKSADANALGAGADTSKASMYAPRLEVSFRQSPRLSPRVSPELQRRLQTALARNGSSRIEVLMAGDATILRGQVSSEHDRLLAALLLSFEPGVGRVQNELQVGSPPAPPPPTPVP